MSSKNSEVLPSHLYQSVLTPLAKKAFQRQHYAFCFLYRHIIQIGVDKQGFISFQPVLFTRKLIPYLLSSMIITGLCGLGSCVYCCVTQLVIGTETKAWVNWSLFNTLIMLGMGLGAVFELAGTFILYRSPVVFSAFHKLLLLEQKCICELHENARVEEEIPVRESKRRPAPTPEIKRKTKDPLGLLLNALILIFVSTPIPLAIIGVATNLDPFYFVLEQEFLPDPYYRSIGTIILVPLLRIVLSYFCIIEFMRFFIIFAFVLGVTIFVMVSVSTKLTYVFYDKCLLLFVELRLIFGSVKAFSSDVVSIVIFGSQFVNILLLWMVFKCSELLSPLIYAMICFFAIYAITLCAVLFPTITKIRTETIVLIESKQCLHFCSSNKSKKYYYYSLWKSQQSVYFTCGKFFIFQRGITMSYMENLINNLVNAVLLIDPTN